MYMDNFKMTVKISVIKLNSWLTLQRTNMLLFVTIIRLRFRKAPSTREYV